MIGTRYNIAIKSYQFRINVLISSFQMLLQNLVDDVVESGNSCVVQIVVISESRQLQATLNTFGIHVSINYLLTLPNIQGINKLVMYNLRSPQNIVQIITLHNIICITVLPCNLKTQTPSEVEPIQIWSQWEMVRILQQLGQNQKLMLTGRPPRPIGVLGTCKVTSR